MILCVVSGAAFLRLKRTKPTVEDPVALRVTLSNRVRAIAGEVLREMAGSRPDEFFRITSKLIDKIEQTEVPYKDELLKLANEWFVYQYHRCLDQLFERLSRRVWNVARVNLFFDKLYQGSKHFRAIVDGTCRSASTDKMTLYYAPSGPKPVAVVQDEAKLDETKRA